MAPKKKGNRNLALRLLLFTGYLVLFTTQFNARYYSTANFFVYHNSSGSGTASATTKSTPPGINHSKDHNLAFATNTHGPSHLSIDKRFPSNNTIKPVFICYALTRPAGPIPQKTAHPQTQEYSSSDLPTNALRGPPHA